MEFLIITILGVALAIATVTDLRSQRIYNWLTFPLMASGLLAHTVFGGWDGFLLSAGGFGLGLGVMVIPFFLGMMGAGDVKLMAGIGAWLGVNTTLSAFLLTCIVGGVYAVVILFRNLPAVKAILANFWGTILRALSTKKLDYTPVSDDFALPRLCYGVAIAAGTVAAMIITFNQTGSILVR